MKLAGGGLYAILDAGTVPVVRRPWAAAAAIAGGARVIQYRHKPATASGAEASARTLLAVCRRRRVPLIVNDDLELAAGIGADGVHLGRNDATIAAARARLGAATIVGATCHASLEAATAAVAAGADYVSFGRFFASRTKPDAPSADPAVLTAAKRRLNVPIVAVGGVTAGNGGALLAAGADWLAAAQSVFGTGGTRAAAGKLAQLFDRTQ